jgi:LemA protein
MSIWILVGAVVLVLFIVGMYNGLVRRRNEVDQAYGTIEVQLVQRYDLIPKLVETVKQYMGHERGLLENIVRLRNEAMDATVPAEKIRKDNELTHSLNALRVNFENYPQLRASENFMHLQRTLNEVEEQLAAARRSYNAAVTAYNTNVQTFPSALIAGPFGFDTKPMFAAEPRKREDVDMQGLFKA